MLVKNPKYRHKLSTNQTGLLKLLFKFRFVTTDLVAELIGKDRSTIYESLYVLGKQGYVAKQYGSSYRLRQRPASYCLAAKGIRYLWGQPGLEEKTLRNFYKSRRAPETVVDRCLDVFKIYLALMKSFGPDYQIFTKHELSRDKFVSPMPELFIQGKTNQPDYVVDIFSAGTFSWLLRKRIQQHNDFADGSNYQYPHVLCIAQNASTELRMFKFTYENYEDFEFYVTQQELLLSGEPKIWIDPDESDEDELIRAKLS